MKFVKSIILGIGLVGSSMLGTYLMTNEKEPLNYNGKIKNTIVVYRQGDASKPDTMEVFYDDKKSLDPMFQQSLPMLEVFNDYDRSGVIGDHEKDMYALFSEREIKPADVDPVFPEDTTGYSLDFPRLELNINWKRNIRYRSRTVCTNSIFGYNDDFVYPNTNEDRKFIREAMKVATKKYKDYMMLILQDRKM